MEVITIKLQAEYAEESCGTMSVGMIKRTPSPEHRVITSSDEHKRAKKQRKCCFKH